MWSYDNEYRKSLQNNKVGTYSDLRTYRTY